MFPLCIHAPLSIPEKVCCHLRCVILNIVGEHFVGRLGAELRNVISCMLSSPTHGAALNAEDLDYRSGDYDDQSDYCKQGTMKSIPGVQGGVLWSRGRTECKECRLSVEATLVQLDALNDDCVVETLNDGCEHR